MSCHVMLCYIIHVWIYIYIYNIHVYICICIYIYIYIHMYICHMRACVCVCIYIYIYRERYITNVIVYMNMLHYLDVSYGGRPPRGQLALAEGRAAVPGGGMLRDSGAAMPVSAKKQLFSLLKRAAAMQASGKDRPPALDLVLCEPIFQRVLFSRGMSFSQTPVLTLNG